MEKEKFMLIHMDKNVHRFDSLRRAILYAMEHCRGSHEYYIIVDTVENKVIDKWSY